MLRAQYNAFDLLRADHMRLEAMLVRLRLMKEPRKRKELFGRIAKELEKHMWIEEEIFYPRCARIPGLEETIDRSHADHQLVKAVIKDLREIDPSTARYDGLLTKAILAIERHVHTEENRVFAAASRQIKSPELRELSQEMISAHGRTTPVSHRVA